MGLSLLAGVVVSTEDFRGSIKSVSEEDIPIRWYVNKGHQGQSLAKAFTAIHFRRVRLKRKAQRHGCYRCQECRRGESWSGNADRRLSHQNVHPTIGLVCGPLDAGRGNSQSSCFLPMSSYFAIERVRHKK